MRCLATATVMAKGLSSLYDLAREPSAWSMMALKDTVANEVIDQINREFPVRRAAVAHGCRAPAHPGTHQRPGRAGFPAQQRLFRLPD